MFNLADNKVKSFAELSGNNQNVGFTTVHTYQELSKQVS